MCVSYQVFVINKYCSMNILVLMLSSLINTHKYGIFLLVSVWCRFTAFVCAYIPVLSFHAKIKSFASVVVSVWRYK